MVVLDKTPEEPRETIEMKASKDNRQPAPQAPQPESLQDRLQAAIGAAALQTPQRGTTAGAEDTPAGAAAAAGVLTAVDEDEEGEEDAPVPNEFQYESEGEEEEE